MTRFLGMSSQRLRKEVWKQTKQIYAEKTEGQSDFFQYIPSTAAMLALQKFPSTTVEFLKADPIDVACTFGYNGASVALVCDAMWNSNKNFVEHGFNSLEAEIYRRSDYHKHLQIENFYPLGPLDTFLSKNVQFIRVGLDKQYFFIDKPIYMNIVTAPALDHPHIKGSGKLFASASDEELMENKIKIMLYVAARSGVNYIVIPAWGCKEHRCPPYHVGALFHKVLQENNGLFHKVVFSIQGALMEDFKEGFNS